MIKKYYDNKHLFREVFNTETGFYARSGVIIDGKDTGVDPFMRDFPQLIDVGVMGHCVHGKTGLCMKSGVQCYQNGLHTNVPNMSLENFKRIVDECKDKTFQFALGGRGDVDQHENFEDILRYCRENDIVPNFTSSGLGFTDEIVALCKEFCGAVAISWYRQEHTTRSIKMLLDAGVTTNIHYVLGNNSIDEAILRLKENDFPKGINAVVFLLHKPVGLGQESNVLKADDPRVKEFFEIVDTCKFDFSIGFDSCNAPAIVNFTHNINMDSMDYCEGARYSMYIDAEMNAMPCSFANQDSSWFVNLNENTIEEAWNSDVFNRFRYSLGNSCARCKDRLFCGGGCPLVNQTCLCDRAERNFVYEG